MARKIFSCQVRFYSNVRTTNIANEEGVTSKNGIFIQKEAEGLEKAFEPLRKDILTVARKVIRMVREESIPSKRVLSNWIQNSINQNFDRYSSYLHSQSEKAALSIQPVAPVYEDEVKMEDGRIVLRENYRKLLEKYPELLVFGEDAGNIGGVNQTLEGLQEQLNYWIIRGVENCKHPQLHTLAD